jgi:hypothetical protein
MEAARIAAVSMTVLLNSTSCKASGQEFRSTIPRSLVLCDEADWPGATGGGQFFWGRALSMENGLRHGKTAQGFVN